MAAAMAPSMPVAAEAGSTPCWRARPRWHRVIEWGLVVALAAAGFWYGRFAFLHASHPPDHYHLAPAVMVASGYGFQAPVPRPGSPLDEFLSRRTERVDAASAVPAALTPPEPFDWATRYLLFAVGWWWRLTDISWARLADVAGALHGMAVLGMYALGRLLLSRPLAVLGALWVCTSTLYLSVVPHVRDYSKAAFILTALAMVAALVLRAIPPRARYGLAGGLGLVTGTGIGFRMDVIVMVPFVVGAVILCAGRRPWTDWRLKGLVLAAFAVGLALPAGPVIAQLRRGGANDSHVALLGHADTFDVGLGIAPSVYRLVPFYNDTYVIALVRGHASAPAAARFDIPSPEYAAASRQLWLDLIRTFPADVYTRALAAAAEVLNLAFRSPTPSFLTARVPAQDACAALYVWLSRFDGLGTWLGLSVVPGAFAVSVRHGFFAMLLVALASYASLQFADRHYFHLQALSVLALLAAGRLLVAAARAAWRARRVAGTRGARVLLARRALARVAVGLLVVTVSTVVPLASLRLLQGVTVERAVSRTLQAERSRVPVAWEPAAHAGWLGRWPTEGDAAPGPAPVVHLAYYLLEFRTAESRPISVGLRYASTRADADFSRVISLTTMPGTNRIAFAAPSVGGLAEFVGVEMGSETKDRLHGIYQVASPPAGLPIDLRLPADWASRPLWQRLRLEEGDGWRSEHRAVVCAFDPGCRGLMSLVDRAPGLAGPIPVGNVTAYAPAVSARGGHLLVNGPVASASAYLAALPEQAVAEGSSFVATGWLAPGGGLVVGLLRDFRWAGQAFIWTPGPFVAVVPVAEPGIYTPLIASAMPPGRRWNRAEVSGAGFVAPSEP